MPGGVDITGAVGDVGVFQQEATGTQTWRCVSFKRAAELEKYVTQSPADNSTKIATTAYADYLTGTEEWVNYGTVTGDGTSEYLVLSTAIPAGAKALKIAFSIEWDTASALSSIEVNVGDAATGYAAGDCFGMTNGINMSNRAWANSPYMEMIRDGDTTIVAVGTIEMRKGSASPPFWALRSHLFADLIGSGPGSSDIYVNAGQMVMDSGEIDRIRLYTRAGNFDTGSSATLWVAG